MAGNETKPSADDGREELVAKQLASIKIHLALTQERADVSDAIKLPLERVPPARHSARLTPLDIPHRHQYGERTYAAPANRQVWQSA